MYRYRLYQSQWRSMIFKKIFLTQRIMWYEMLGTYKLTGFVILYIYINICFYFSKKNNPRKTQYLFYKLFQQSFVFN